MDNIYTLMPRAMEMIGVVGKDQKFSGGKVNYNFRGIDGALNACHPVFQKLGITPSTKVIQYNSEAVEIGQYKTPGYHVTLLMEVSFFAPDGTFITSTMAGEGLDTSDKATNKAMAAAFKYALYYTLCVATEEMAKDDSDHESPQLSQRHNDEPAAEKPPVNIVHLKSKDGIEFLMKTYDDADKAIAGLSETRSVGPAAQEAIQEIYAKELANG
jgi:hypothetical protein